MRSKMQSVSEHIWPGMGLFGESYLLFSIGVFRPIWELLFPDCFDGITCSNTLLGSLTYTVVIGIIIGMVSIGLLAGRIGRRNGSIVTATFMTIGSIGLTFGAYQFRNNPQALLKNMDLCLFIFGIGVGGEYPLSASSASERAMSETKAGFENDVQQPSHNFHNPDEGDSDITASSTVQIQTRGKSVILVFSMQGAGIFVNTLSIFLLLFITGQHGNKGGNDQQQYYGNDDGNEYYNRIAGNYDLNTLLIIWLLVYAFGALTLLYVLISRIMYLKESQIWEEDMQQRNNIQDSKNEYYNMQLDENTFFESESAIDNRDDVSKTQMLLRHYGARLFGTSTSWLLWDIAFYGNKLFQSSFLYALTGEDATLFDISSVALLNAFVSLLGYYAAAALVDRPKIGRLKLQQYGFLLTGTLFCLCGYLRENISTVWLVIMYLGSSFFGQCGPNCTTFLIPAEIFPTEMRTMCHGISAATGKLGALVAAILFNYLSESGMFLISGYCSFLALAITCITIPETGTLDLHQLDMKWRLILAGKSQDYRGNANEFRYMSFYERWNGK